MYSLLSYNTFGIDVSAARFLEYTSVEELQQQIAQGAVTTPFLHIGGGSNLLFTKDYDGWVQALYGMTLWHTAWHTDGTARKISP